MDSSQTRSCLPAEFDDQARELCEKTEALALMKNKINEAYEDTKNVIETTSAAIISDIREQETRLVNELAVRYHRQVRRLTSGQDQLTERIQDITRILARVQMPISTSTDWTLPTVDEVGAQLVARFDDVRTLLDKVYAENSMVSVYTPAGVQPNLGSLQWCSISQYTSGSTSTEQSTHRDHVHNTENSSCHGNELAADNENGRSRNECLYLQPEIAVSSSSDSNSKDVDKIVGNGTVSTCQLKNIHYSSKSDKTLQATREHSRLQTTNDVGRLGERRRYESERQGQPKAPVRKRKVTYRSLSAHTRGVNPVANTHRHSEPQPLRIRAENLYKLDKIGHGSGELKQPKDVVVLPDGSVIVADHDNQRLQEFNREGQPVKLFDHPKTKPKALALTRGKYVVVLDMKDRSIKTFSQGAQLIGRFGVGYIHDPCAVAITAKDHYVIIDSRLNYSKKVFIYDPMTGDQKRIGFHDDTYVFSNPEGVAVSQDNQILITDAGHHCLLFFSEDGKFLKKTGQQGQGAGEFWYPKGITVDYHNNILISDCGNHRVCLLDKNGSYLCDVLNKWHGLHFPINIAINHQNVLALVQNAEVYAFRLNYPENMSTSRSADPSDRAPRRDGIKDRALSRSRSVLKDKDQHGVEIMKLEMHILDEGLLF